MKFSLFAKVFVAGFMLLLTPARADVMAVWGHSLIDGSTAKNIKLYETARPIFEKLGAKVEFYTNDMFAQPGTSFVARFADMRSWGTFRDRLNMHPDFLAWNKRYGDNVARIETQNFVVQNTLYPDAPVTVTDNFDLFYYSAWKPMPGKAAALRADVRRASTMAEDMGGSANVYQGGFDDTVHVFWSFPSWTFATQFMVSLQTDKKWSAMWSNLEKNPSGSFLTHGYHTKVYPYEGE